MEEWEIDLMENTLIIIPFTASAPAAGRMMIAEQAYKRVLESEQPTAGWDID